MSSETDVRRVGSALRRGIVVVDLGVSLREVVVILAESKDGVIAVADPTGRVAGVIHESNVLPELCARNARRADIAHLALRRAGETMVSSSPMLESSPLREALLDMASNHSRCIVAVGATGAPVGVLWDVDALHTLFGTDL